ncbi:MAG: hypothetical protein ACXAB8_20365, partial [Promethearchaeota archaeon]
TTKQKVIGLGIVAVTGIVAIGQKDKKKLPSGGIADYLKGLGGGGGGGGGGMRSASPKPSSQDEEGEEETTDFIDEAGEPLSLLDIFNINVDDGPTTEEEAQLELQELQEEYSDIADITYDDDDGLNIDWNLNPGWGSLGGGLPFLEQTVANPPEGMAITTNPIPEGTSPFFSGDWNLFSPDWDSGLNQGPDYDYYMGPDQEEETTTTPAVYGCTEVNAYNYNPEATVDDGSCLSISSSGYGPMLAEGETKSKLDSWLQQFKDEDSDDEDIIAKLPIIGTFR